MGHFDRNQAIDAKQIRDGRWKTPAAEILETLTAKAPAGWLDRRQRLTIVPDGVLWHVPFEALPRDTPEGAALLIESHRVRYLPTAGLLAGDGRSAPARAKTALVVGKLFPRDGDALAVTAADELKALDPTTQRLDEFAGPSNLAAALCDRLVVLDDIKDADRAPYDWSPAQLDNVTLSQWMTMPWGAAQQLVLPGFHTAAENGLKRGGSGDEVFLTVCGMLSSGVRTALVSRWRTGGRSSVDLTREFVQELPFVRPDDAWQRSVLLVRNNALDVEMEPRVKLSAPDPSLTYEHPFFWSGYLLVDISAAAPGEDGATN
jgi:CHAT domain-containing protein